MKKRCICGGSDLFPICDGKHGGHQWNCTPIQQEHHTHLIISTPALYSLAEFISHQQQILLVHQDSHVHSCDELVILNDGHHIDHLLPLLLKIQHRTRRIINLACPLPIALSNHETSEAIELISFQVATQDVETLKDLHAAVRALMYAPAVPTDIPLPVRIFISHAIEDEQYLMPVIQTLRIHYGMNVFLCADSIMGGSDWYTSIEQSLVQSDLVFAICSQNFNRSTFCAFEIGMARALQKNIYPIMLDQHPPPAYIQHLNAVSVQRQLIAYPWLTYQDALLQACFVCVHSFHKISMNF